MVVPLLGAGTSTWAYRRSARSASEERVPDADVALPSDVPALPPSADSSGEAADGEIPMLDRFDESESSSDAVAEDDESRRFIRAENVPLLAPPAPWAWWRWWPPIVAAGAVATGPFLPVVSMAGAALALDDAGNSGTVW